MLCGNTNNLGDIGTYPWKSFLFFLTAKSHGIGLSRDMARRQEEQFIFRAGGAFVTISENPSAILKFIQNRTITASGL
jgi:hypothetical protein